MGTDRTKTFLREWREFRGYTLEAAADAIGQSYSFLSRVELGRQRYNQDVLEALAQLYDCHPMELVFQDPREGSSLIQLWSEADVNQRRALSAVGRTLLGYRDEAIAASKRRRG